MRNTPTILGVAESTHYLVGTTDQSGDLVALSQLDEVAICRSLEAAKLLLKDYNVQQAQLVLETAYDEMCGLPSSGSTIQTIHLK